MHALLYLSLFRSSLHTISAVSMFVWFCFTYWLVFIICGVKDVWAFGLMFLTFYPFLDWALWAKALIFLPSPCFPLLRPWAFWLLILPYHFIVPAIALPSFLLRITLWTCGLMFLQCQPTSSAIFYSGLPWPTFHIFTSFGLY